MARTTYKYAKHNYTMQAKNPQDEQATLTQILAIVQKLITDPELEGTVDVEVAIKITASEGEKIARAVQKWNTGV